MVRKIELNFYSFKGTPFNFFKFSTVSACFFLFLSFLILFFVGLLFFFYDLSHCGRGLCRLADTSPATFRLTSTVFPFPSEQRPDALAADVALASAVAACGAVATAASVVGVSAPLAAAVCR